MIGLFLLAGLTYYVLSHPNRDRAERLRGELEELRGENDVLAKENAELEKTILALRADPRLAERRARETAGLARPGEVIYQFEEPDVPIEVGVRLEVTGTALELAGKGVELDALPDALRELRRQLPGARVDVEFEDGIDPIRKREVLDAVELAEEEKR